VRGIDPRQAEAWLGAAVDNVTREYPNAPQLRLDAPDDLVTPRELHPAFYGSFDWHSSVHMHWSMARLLRSLPELERADEARQVLTEHLTAEHVAAEAAYLERRPGFERPYGWAWALALHAELARDGAAVDLADVMTPLTERIETTWSDYLPRAAFPHRSGLHSSTAFAMVLGLDAARRLGREALAERLLSHARRFFLHDTEAPTAYEPSGEDFLSPTLTEAHLMTLVLDGDTFPGWLDGFLPGIAEVIPASLREPVEPLDDSDGRLVHLRGLNLSRAWSWRAIGSALPPRDERRVAAYDAADRHLAGALEHVVTGGYMGDHWLVSFALLASGGL
jgi:hypothetical protein